MGLVLGMNCIHRPPPSNHHKLYASFADIHKHFREFKKGKVEDVVYRQDGKGEGGKEKKRDGKKEKENKGKAVKCELLDTE